MGLPFHALPSPFHPLRTFLKGRVTCGLFPSDALFLLTGGRGERLMGNMEGTGQRENSRRVLQGNTPWGKFPIKWGKSGECWRGDVLTREIYRGGKLFTKIFRNCG